MHFARFTQALLYCIVQAGRKQYTLFAHALRKHGLSHRSCRRASREHRACIRQAGVEALRTQQASAAQAHRPHHAASSTQASRERLASTAQALSRQCASSAQALLQQGLMLGVAGMLHTAAASRAHGQALGKQGVVSITRHNESRTRAHGSAQAPLQHQASIAQTSLRKQWTSVAKASCKHAIIRQAACLCVSAWSCVVGHP